jgi:Na+/H+ antiporter NhaD/arsenite permease-like protein
LAAILIFLAVYLVLAIGRLPGFRVDRTGACIIGASLMIAFGVLDLSEAYAAIDYDTITLLFGMMIVVANLRLSGFFGAVAEHVVEYAHRPLVLLAAIVFVAGFFSAFFVNDTMCLVLTPLVLEITRQLRRNAVPYLLAVAMAANVGSVATITGNPQNMMIGSFSGIHYRVFAAALAPVAAAGLLITTAVIASAYHREFRFEEKVVLERRPVHIDRVLLWKSLAVSAGMVVLFFAGWQVSKVALMAGAVLLVTRRVKPEKIYREIDWPLLVLFLGLFIVVAGVEKTPLPGQIFRAAAGWGLNRTWVLSTAAALLSNLVSNVPAVLVFKPFVAHLNNPAKSWLTLAMSSTLAGNLTVLGSVANLIVIQRARHQVRISFWEYLKIGVPVTVLSIGVGVLLLG